METKSAMPFYRLGAGFACTVLLAACLPTRALPVEAASQPGQMRVFFEPADEQGVCALTVELRNLSDGWRGEAWLRLAFLDAQGSQLVADQELRLDPLLPGRISAKNLPVPLSCAVIERMTVRSAQWGPYPALVVEDPTVYVIGGVAGTTWTKRWDEAQRLFVGEAVTG